MTINKENLETWLTALETTEEQQCQNHLVEVLQGNEDGAKPVLGFCCLGLGSTLVPTIEYSAPVENEPGDYGYFDGYDDLAPPDFLHWLGLTPKTGEFESGTRYEMASNIYIDYPAGLMAQGFHGQDPDSSLLLLRGDCGSAANLNDRGLTFKQIAETIRYFGLIEDPYTEGVAS